MSSRLAGARRAPRSTRRARPCRSSSATTTRAGATRGCSRCSTCSPRCAAGRPRGHPGGARRRRWRASWRARPAGRPAPARLAHVNHEREGRKCEFGPARGAAAQRRDIAAGRERLADLLGAARRPDLHPALEPLHRRHRPLPRRARLRGALARGARGAARRAGPARAAGQRRLVRPPPRRAAEPAELGGADRRRDRLRRAGRRDVPPRGHGRRGDAARGELLALVAGTSARGRCDDGARRPSGVSRAGGSESAVVAGAARVGVRSTRSR